MKMGQYLFIPYAYGNTHYFEVVINLLDMYVDLYWEFSEVIEFILQLYKTGIYKSFRVNITNWIN